MDILVPKIIKYQLYLLQLENYELGRYFRLLFQKGLWPKGEQRKQLVWTAKARLLFILSLLTHLVLLGCAVGLSFKSGLSVLSIMYYVLSIALFGLYFILYTLYTILLWPFDYLAKHFVIIRAKFKVKNLPNLKIIGIAGSYGKTTMKEVIKQVLSIKYKVLSTPESVNTPLGIAKWILKRFDSSLEIAIVEMGEHYENDIKDICDIVKPDIAVVAGINEAHLERMKKMETVVATIFEIVSNSKAGAAVMLNADDKLVMENYQKFIWPDHKVEKFSIFNFSAKGGSRSAGQFSIFDQEKFGWKAEAGGIGSIFVNLLGEYSLGDVDAAVKIGQSLGMTTEEIRRGIMNIKPVEHRLQPIKSPGNVLVIDDSYNGNPAGAAEAIKVLSHFVNRRKIYITPGLVEMGKSAPEVHRQIGKQLAEVADIVILIKNSVTGFIAEGIQTTPSRSAGHPSLVPTLRSGSSTGGDAPRVPQNNRGASPPDKGEYRPQGGEGGGVKKSQIIWFNSAPEAHASLNKILKPGDVILFQNDWGDQYV